MNVLTARHAACSRKHAAAPGCGSVADVLAALSDDSVSSILNADGSTLVNENFTAYGDRRDPTTWNGSASSDDLSASAGVTRQGYTWQTALGNMGLNHMNGRVQDAITGVFLSPDPYISEPGNPQNYNRYSYVLNNPLSFTDPSGYRRVKVKRLKLVKSKYAMIQGLDENHNVIDTWWSDKYSLEWETVVIDIPSWEEGIAKIRDVFGFSDSGTDSTDNGSSGGDGKNPQELAAETQNQDQKQQCLSDDPPIEQVCPECYLMGVGRLAYAGLAKLIPAIGASMEESALGQAAYAVAARNSLKDLFRGPLAPVFSGVRQPTFAASLAKYNSDSYAIIDAASRTNAAVNAAGATGAVLGAGLSIANQKRCGPGK